MNFIGGLNQLSAITYITLNICWNMKHNAFTQATQNMKTMIEKYLSKVYFKKEAGKRENSKRKRTPPGKIITGPRQKGLVKKELLNAGLS